MKVIQISIGRFHHFHLARQLEKKGLLDSIYTSYPKFKLKDEHGIPTHKIKTFPWLQTPYLAYLKMGLTWPALSAEWSHQAHKSLDNFVSHKITKPTIVMALSGSGLKSGQMAKKQGGIHICDRGSTHIVYQHEILNEEYSIRGLKFKGIDKRVIQRELAEYEQADIITVPSEFVRKSFLEKGVKNDKIRKVVYGARLDRFKKIGDISPNKFRVLWVGAISIRKGFLDVLSAFNQFKHPNKELIVIGSVHYDINGLIQRMQLDNVTFKGTVSNSELATFYSTSNVFVLTSIEEGLANVQGEALACGCPVIATPNTGAEDLFTDGKEGFIIPIRSPQKIKEKFEILAESPDIRMKMSLAAIQKTKEIGGWDSYGNQFESMIEEYLK